MCVYTYIIYNNSIYFCIYCTLHAKMDKLNLMRNPQTNPNGRTCYVISGLYASEMSRA